MNSICLSICLRRSIAVCSRRMVRVFSRAHAAFISCTVRRALCPSRHSLRSAHARATPQCSAEYHERNTCFAASDTGAESACSSALAATAADGDEGNRDIVDECESDAQVVSERIAGGSTTGDIMPIGWYALGACASFVWCVAPFAVGWKFMISAVEGVISTLMRRDVTRME
jgi:hypothetical protein